jgi:hypothetical protein
MKPILIAQGIVFLKPRHNALVHSLSFQSFLALYLLILTTSREANDGPRTLSCDESISLTNCMIFGENELIAVGRTGY